MSWNSNFEKRIDTNWLYAWMQLLVLFDLFHTQQHMQLLGIHSNFVYMGKLPIAR